MIGIYSSLILIVKTLTHFSFNFALKNIRNT